MEYMPNGDLQTYMLNHRDLRPSEIWSISFQMLQGVDFMHKKGVSHTDLKPANLLIGACPPTHHWHILLSDFGIGKKMEELRNPSHEVPDTLDFVAPELLGFEVNSSSLLYPDDRSKAADIWASGEIMFRMLTGQTLFQNNRELLSKYAKLEIEFPGDRLLHQKGVSA